MPGPADSQDEEEEIWLTSKAISEPCLQRKLKKNNQVVIVQRMVNDRMPGRDNEINDTTETEEYLEKRNKKHTPK